MKTKQVSIRLFPLLIIILVIIAIIITAIVVLNRTGNEKKDEIIHQYAGSGTVDDPYRIEKVEDFINRFFYKRRCFFESCRLKRYCT